VGDREGLRLQGENLLREKVEFVLRVHGRSLLLFGAGLSGRGPGFALTVHRVTLTDRSQRAGRAPTDDDSDL
ncbi:hypothetical protein, partial [Paractinoplanes hotanensis]